MGTNDQMQKHNEESELVPGPMLRAPTSLVGIAGLVAAVVSPALSASWVVGGVRVEFEHRVTSLEVTTPLLFQQIVTLQGQIHDLQVQLEQVKGFAKKAANAGDGQP